MKNICNEQHEKYFNTVSLQYFITYVGCIYAKDFYVKNIKKNWGMKACETVIRIKWKKIQICTECGMECT